MSTMVACPATPAEHSSEDQLRPTTSSSVDSMENAMLIRRTESFVRNADMTSV